MFKIIQKITEESIDWFWSSIQKITERTMSFLRKSVERVSRVFTSKTSPSEGKKEKPPVVVAEAVSLVCAPTKHDQLPKPQTDTKPGIPSWRDQDAYRAYTLDLILELRRTGLTLKKIADQLYDSGVKTRTGKQRWTTGTISKIIRNEGSSIVPAMG